MAQRDKNDSLKDRIHDKPGRPRRQRKEARTDEPCAHSIGIPSYLLEAPQTIIDKTMATDKLSQLRRLYKKEFGYKPTGMKVAELEDILRSRSVSLYGDPDIIVKEDE